MRKAIFLRCESVISYVLQNESHVVFWAFETSFEDDIAQEVDEPLIKPLHKLLELAFTHSRLYEFPLFVAYPYSQTVSKYVDPLPNLYLYVSFAPVVFKVLLDTNVYVFVPSAATVCSKYKTKFSLDVVVVSLQFLNVPVVVDFLF